MKTLLYLTASALGSNRDRFGCEWVTGGTGDFIECEPDFYIQGACESGQNKDCKVEGLVGHDAFGIRCCPVKEGFQFSNPRECKWFGGASWGFVSISFSFV